MRRSHRGGVRGGPSWQSTSGTPLIADHNLQDIDKELELLQRKREIIEQQQQMLSGGFRRNDYQEPYQGQNSRYDDYSQSYDDTRPYNPPSRKRPVPVWETDVPTKRFSGAVASKSRPYGRASIPSLMHSGTSYRGRYQGSVPRQPSRPLTGPFKPKPQKKDAIPPKRDHTPQKRESPTPKATKPTSTSNKPPAHLAVERKVAEPLESGDLDNRLCSDRQPPKYVQCRLELALGTIFKEIKASDPSVSKSPPAVMREIKATLRERIRGVMMNRIVRSADTIIARYREVYDLQSDLEIVANTLEALDEEVTVSKIDDPEKYFKVNMQKIMHNKLKRLLDKLEEISRAESKSLKSGDSSEKKTEETENEVLDEEITSSPKYIILEKWMSSKMTGLIKKFLPFILKIMDIDQKYSKLKNMITSETVKLLIQKDEQATADPSNEAIQSINASLNSTVNTPRSTYKPMLYFAKLMGKPALPKRNQMEKFFAEFQPKSIKKHRTVHNLLFVGFTDKESLDRILAADGTVLGKFTLSIRISERANQKGEAVKKELNSSMSSDDKLIGAELDDQITDLLSCIRKAEENGECDSVMNDENTDKATDVAKENSAENADANVSANTDANIVENADAKSTEIADADITNADGDTTNAEGDITKTDADITNTDADITNADANITNADADITNADADITNADPDIIEITDIKNSDTDIIEIPDATEDADTKVVEKTAEINNSVTTEGGNANVDTEKKETKSDNDVIAEESADTVQPLETKPAGRCTPTRTSARLAATPSRIQTRRASRLAQNDA